MKKVLRVVGISIAVVVLAIFGLGAFINFKAYPTFEEVTIPDLTVEITPERLAHGKKLVHANCAGCHKSKNNVFEGTYFDDIDAEKAFGVIYTSNITQHPEHGIGQYSDGELYRLLRTGVMKNNELALPVMPKWVICSDEDIYAMIAYLKSDDKYMQASDKQHPAYEPTFLAKALKNFAFKPAPYQASYHEIPSLEDSIAYGEYAVNAVYGCYFCHSKNMEEWDVFEPKNTPNYLGGGYVFNTSEHEVTASRLIMDDQSDIGKWSKVEFLDALKYGQREGKEAYKMPMKPYVYLDTAEVNAIYYYLKDYSSKLAVAE